MKTFLQRTIGRTARREYLVRLTQEQLDIVDGLDAISRIAVQGSAGRGKTLVAAARGAKVLMLRYNVLLAEPIARSARGFAAETPRR